MSTETERPICAAFNAIVDLALSLGVRDICKLPECWEHKVDELVHAPFSGTIKRISWQGQQDHDLIAILSLAVDDPDTKHERPK